ncbi:MAG TPA: CRISPR-associated endonuclease Cas1 [Pseudothermotoga sp.]|nr:CRISPR-associated endonuclease Cas1 [Pseudothermotoga sp.]HOK83189.1 CRISPR-associated endonuclease Cas1 [Pseudothermotoga sp.]HPP71085.1 CRISPR-associated endonuclease Cas1 [Pseudothermotoga sp.]
MVLYVTEQGAVLSKELGKLIISKQGDIISELPLKKIEKVNLMGNISLTPQILNYFLDNKIEVVFMTQYGKYRGKLYTNEYRNVLLRLKQYERSMDQGFKLKIAQSIVAGKLKNYYDFLMNRSKSLTRGILSEEIAALRKVSEKINETHSIDQVMGLEGIGSKYYFQGFAKLFKSQEFKFEKRIAHPPKDPVNTMLSLGYSLLYNEIEAAINAVGLDPYLGNLHTTDISKKSLLFDLTEEFRCIIVDNFVINAINRNEFTPEDFEEKDEGVIHFTKNAIKNFISKFEERLNTKMRYHLDDEENYIRTIFEKQARHYARVVLGEDEQYIPFFRK